MTAKTIYKDDNRFQYNEESIKISESFRKAMEEEYRKALEAGFDHNELKLMLIDVAYHVSTMQNAVWSAE